MLRSTNPAATDLLVASVGSSYEPLRVGAVRALALRDDGRGHRELVERFDGLASDARSALAEIDPRSPLLSSLIGQIDPTTPHRAKRAVEVALAWRAIGVLPKVVEAAQWPGGTHAEFFAKASLRLAGELEHALREEEERLPGDGRRRGEDPAFPRRTSVNALALALDRFDQHRSTELVEAMLLLTPHDEPAMVRALRDENHPAHEELMAGLRTSASRGAVTVLTGLLRDPSAPQEMLKVAAGRSDAATVGSILHRLGTPIGSRARSNAERIESFGWFEPSRLHMLLDFSGDEQSAAIQLAASSRASRRTLAGAVTLLLQRGEESGRRAACHAIEYLPDHLSHEPLSVALMSLDTTVVASASRMLRKKGFPQATGELVRMLDSTDDVVRHSAQRGLSDLSFSAFRDHFESLPPESRRRAGVLVGKADPFAAVTLVSELRSGAVGRRLKAMEWIELMELTETLLDNLIEATSDRDTGVRSEAVRLLGAVPANPAVLGALNTALKDRSGSVRSAAEASLTQIGAPGLQGAAATTGPGDDAT